MTVYLTGGLVPEAYSGQEISRTIKIRGHQTLHDLHQAISKRSTASMNTSMNSTSALDRTTARSATSTEVEGVVKRRRGKTRRRPRSMP